MSATPTVSFLSVAIGTSAPGLLAGFCDPADKAPCLTVLGLAAVAVGALPLVAARPVVRLMRGVR